MISPRLGFNWNPSESGKDQVRGGIGVFAGRTPFVWISNAYGGTGIEITNLSATQRHVQPGPQQPAEELPARHGRRLGRHHRPRLQVPAGPSQHPRLRPRAPVRDPRRPSRGCSRRRCRTSSTTTRTRSTTGNKTFYGAPDLQELQTPRSRTSPTSTNTTQGEQQNLTVQLEKRFPFGLYLNGSYAYMNAKAAFEATSSVAYSNWQFQTTNGDIYTQQLTRSFFEVPHRFNIVVSQTFRTGPADPQHRARLHRPVGAALLDPDGRRPEQGRRLRQRPPLRARTNYSDIVWKGTGGAPTEDAVERLPLDDGPRRVPRPGRRAQRARRPVDPHARLPLRLRGSRSRWSRCSSRSTS